MLAHPARSWLLDRLLISLVILAFVAWLAKSSNPTRRREKLLNALIESGKLGAVNPVLEKRLELQFPWLARHAGALIPTSVNGPIHGDRLNLIVTTPLYEKLTHCGTGNAVFDPGLNTIFVDEALLWPTEVNIIGSTSLASMFTVNDYGYVVSYTNFILAHELGHWQKHHKASAFFYYGWADGNADLEEEKAADRSAITTIFAARLAGDEPAELRKLDALSVIGLEASKLNPEDGAAGDIFGGMILMTKDLLFSSSPFSPYYSNKTHPNMLERVDEAIRRIELTPPGVELKTETALVHAQLVRFTALGTWKHRELFFSGPVSFADIRNGFLWIGRADIPALADTRLKQQVQRIPLAALSTEAGGDAADPGETVKTYDSEIAQGGFWIEKEFKDGDPSIGLPPVGTPEDPWLDSDWYSMYDYLLQYHWRSPKDDGRTWRWPARGRRLAGLTTAAHLLSLLQQSLRGRRFEVGRLQWSGEKLVLPVAVRGKQLKSTFLLYEVSPLEPYRLTAVPGFHFVTIGNIEVSAVRVWNGKLWIPVRFASMPADHVELWQVTQSGAHLFDTAKLIDVPTLNDLQVPSNPSFVPISGGRAVFGYEFESLYLVDETSGRLQLLFHPASAGLQMTDLGAGRLLFWNRFARKAYLVSTDSR